MARVSVIIPAYNAGAYIAQAIDSVLQQTYQDIEILVVDDSSTDETAAIVGSFDGQVRYTRQAHSGIPITRNNAIRATQGEFIAFLEHDDLWLPEKLERQVALLETQPEVALVYSDYYVIDGAGQVRWRAGEKTQLQRGRILQALYSESFICFSSGLLRRSALDRTGLFRPELTICADYDLFLRMAENFEVDFVDRPLTKYRIHETNMSRRWVSMARQAAAIRRDCRQRRPELTARRYGRPGRLPLALVRAFIAEDRIVRRLRAFFKGGDNGRIAA